MDIKYTTKFGRQYKKLPIFIQNLAEIKEEIFRMNPFDPRLKTHKLKGLFEGLWAFRIDCSYRIIFEFLKKNLALFHAVGNHDIYS